MSSMTAAQRPPRPARREPAVPSNVLGMILFVITEIMFFAGMFSAFMIAEGMAVDGWPPAGQPRLPVLATAFNTLALLASGGLLFIAGKRFAVDPETARKPMLGALALGAFFVVFQGVEWVQLIGEGLTLTTSTHGSFFYVMVGIHALHAVAAILSLLWAVRRHGKGALTASQLTTVQVFWYFVVGIWPVLYLQVYL
jgi:heme/copper-type cytochrome/quinol oxidase subunit 3